MTSNTKNVSLVSETLAADPAIAEQHFQSLLSLETDCWDVHESISKGNMDFVLLDVRGISAFNQGHIVSSLSLPHGDICEQRMQQWPKDTLFVVYCAGPHCNGADKAALKLAKLARPVKKMIGGITGWQDEGFKLATL